MSLVIEERTSKFVARGLMQANVFRGPGKFGLEEKPIPRAGLGEAVIRVRLTTICGTDIHIVRGEYPIQPGLTIGHEAGWDHRGTRAWRRWLPYRPARISRSN